MIKQLTRIRCDECFTEFERNEKVIVLTPIMLYTNGGKIEHVCQNCYNKDCQGLDYQVDNAENLTKKWKEERGL
jgi:hypothetical protein